VVSIPLKNISQLASLFPIIIWKVIKDVPNHQPVVEWKRICSSILTPCEASEWKTKRRLREFNQPKNDETCESPRKSKI